MPDERILRHWWWAGARDGMAARSSLIENYPGFYQISGESLMRLVADQAESAGAVMYDEVVVGFSRKDGMFFVETLSGRTFTAKSVIVSSGRTPRMSGAPGEAELFGRGVSLSTTCDGPLFRGKRVAVYGGGNTAVEMALDMSEIASTVYLLSRSDLTADSATVDRLKEKANVVIETGFVLAAVHGGTALKSVDISPVSDSQKLTALEVGGLFLGLGLTPNTSVFNGAVAMNAAGEILVDENCRTNALGLFAAGDATSIESKQVGVAVGEGIKASLAAARYLKSPSR